MCKIFELEFGQFHENENKEVGQKGEISGLKSYIQHKINEILTERHQEIYEKRANKTKLNQT